MPSRPAPRVGQASVPKFDPNMGTLVGVQCTIDGTANASASFHNLDGIFGVTEGLHIQATFSLNRPDTSTLVLVAAQGNFPIHLGPSQSGTIANTVVTASATTPNPGLSHGLPSLHGPRRKPWVDRSFALHIEVDVEAVQHGAILLTIRLRMPPVSKRWRKVEQVSKNGCDCDVLISSTGEVDAELPIAKAA